MLSLQSRPTARWPKISTRAAFVPVRATLSRENEYGASTRSTVSKAYHSDYSELVGLRLLRWPPNFKCIPRPLNDSPEREFCVPFTQMIAVRFSPNRSVDRFRRPIAASDSVITAFTLNLLSMCAIRCSQMHDPCPGPLVPERE